MSICLYLAITKMDKKNATLLLSPTLLPIFARYPSKVKEVTVHTDAWVSSFNLHSGARLPAIPEDNFAWLSARFYPRVELQQLKIANDFIVLLFALKDLLDNQLEQTQLQAFVEHFIAVTEHRDQPMTKMEARYWRHGPSYGRVLSRPVILPGQHTLAAG